MQAHEPNANTDVPTSGDGCLAEIHLSGDGLAEQGSGSKSLLKLIGRVVRNGGGRRWTQ